ncbi:MAG: chromosomal replication initiator protein DnaA [Chloroflexi bacterium]|nr:chromosomal replication initiator protein DnaA [Chloroflexota bacterium]MBM3183332.1 chromosomal replication initiator protein DnaA [Chloroflexota bacterium]
MVNDKLRTAREIWEAALGELQLQVNKSNFDTWLKGTTGISHQDDTLVVGVPNVFVADWLANRLYSLISRTLANIVGKRLDVQFVVHIRRRAEERPAAMTDGGTSTLVCQPTKDGNTSKWDAFHSILDGGPKVNHYNPRYTFESFVTGECNRMAYTAALEVVESPGQTHNPLFIYGDTALGKTHLLHAIAHAAEAKGLRTVCTSAERFTIEFVTAIKSGTTPKFRHKFRNCDVFLLDDLHFLSGKAQTQECIFHTFNELYDQNCQIVITGDRPPRELTSLQKKLRSRLEWGLAVNLQAPEPETRLAILKAKAKRFKTPVPPEVLQYLANNFQQNVRELEGALNRVVAYAKLSGASLDTRLARLAVQDLLPPEGHPTSAGPAERTIEAVASYYGLTPQALSGKKRDKKAVLARHVAMYLLREHDNCGLTEIGRMLGNRDHSTVLHGCRKIATEINTDSTLASSVQGILQQLNIHKSPEQPTTRGKTTPKRG